MQSCTLKVGDIEIAISEGGAGGRPILLLHGFTGAKEDFTDWIDPLAEAGWHAVAPDHRGHGHSSKPDREDAYSLDTLARDALALVDELGWDRFALLGHSMGGFVAQRIAFGSAQRLSALVLMDTGHGPVATIDPGLVESAVSVVRAGGIDALADVLAGRDSPLDTPAHRRLMAERPGYPQFQDYKFRSVSPHLYTALGREMIMQPDGLDRLRRLPAGLPTLVIVGEQDAPFVRASHEMAEAIPDARLAVIPHAGHSPQFENPDAWWEVLSTFLESTFTS